MKRAILFSLFAIFAASIWAWAQEGPGTVVVQGPGPGAKIAFSARSTPVEGAPYSATITDGSIQTLLDGNRIVQTFTGTMARDSQGRTRSDALLPAIGNLSAENAPRLAFIMDPVAQVSYTLNLTNKIAQKMPMPLAPGGLGGATTGEAASGMVAGGQAAATTSGAAGIILSTGPGGPLPPPLPPPGGGDAVYIQAGSTPGPGGPMPPPFAFQTFVTGRDSAETKTEDLGTQTMEGLLVTGTRTTRTIPAGQIGNDKPITIITEVWTSPDLKIIVSSKRSDPRVGEQTFHLTNISRTEPDASLFAVPSDFKVVEGLQKFDYGISK